MPLFASLLWLVVAVPSTSPSRHALGIQSWQSRDPDRGPLEYGVVGRIGSSRLRHGAPIRSLAFSPAGGLLAASDKQGFVILWESATGRVVRRWHRPDGLRGPVGFSADGNRVLWGGPDGYVRSFDVRTGHEIRAFRTGSPYGVRSIECGKVQVTDLSGRTQVWDEATGRAGGTTIPEERPTEGCSNCRRFRAVVTSETSLIVHDAATDTGQVARPGDHRFARAGCLLFSPDATALFVADSDGGVLHYDRPTGKVKHRYGPFLYYPPDLVAVSPSGSTLAVAAANRIHLFDTGTGREYFPQPEHFAQPPGMRLSADGRRLILTGCYSAPREEVWDLATLRRVSVSSVPMTEWHSGTPLFPRQTADGRVRVTQGGDTQFNQFDSSVLRFWNDQNVAVWSVKKGLSGRGGYAFSADGLLAGVVEDQGIGIYHAATGWPAQVLPYETRLSRREWAGAIAFTPDRHAVVSAHPSGLVYAPLGGGPEPREVRLRPGETLDGREALLTLSPDGRLAVVGTDRLDLVVFELSTLQERFRLPTTVHGPPSALLFAPDGRHLIVANGDSTVTIHDLATGPAPLTGSEEWTGESGWANLSADAGTAFRTMRLLATRPAETVAWLRDRMPPPTEPDEPLRSAVTRLDADRYPVRETAHRELMRAAHRGRPAVLAASRTPMSAEMRRRVEVLLQATRGPDRSPAGLRAARAVEVLERVGTAEACALLQAWAAGPAGETLADAARGAIRRSGARR